MLTGADRADFHRSRLLITYSSRKAILLVIEYTELNVRLPMPVMEAAQLLVRVASVANFPPSSRADLPVYIHRSETQCPTA